MPASARIFATATLLAFCFVPIGATAPRATATAPFVRCADIIGQAASPNQDGYRLVLGRISVPPAYMQQGAVRVTGNGRWTHWRKTGMVVREGNFTVTVSVPKAWRSRAAITWGNNDLPIVSSLKFTGCGNGPLTNVWNAWAGGFYLRAPTACVPLIFRVGTMSETVRFGIGKRCP